MTRSSKLLQKGNYKLWLNVEIVLVCLLIIGVWCLLSLPVIFYHLPSEISPSVNTNATTNSTDSVCSAPVQYTTTSRICFTELSNILTSSNCSSVEGNIFVRKNDEVTATQLIGGLPTLGASAECISKAVPFLCLHLFGLCGGSEVSIQPTISQCEEIRDTLCQQQWVLVQSLGINLPDCAIFPAEASSCPVLNGSLSTNRTSTRNISENSKVAVLECTKGFYRENDSSVCIPSCSKWLEYSEGLSIFIDVISFISAFIGFVAAIAVIIISGLRHERMFSFPSTFIVYMAIDGLALGFFVIVNYMDRNKLFCSSRSLIESLEVVTPFCVISGMLSTYVLLQLALWWIFHTTTLFWKVTLPFHARAFEASGKNKYIHITCVIVGILLPLVPIIASMGNYAVEVKNQNENSTSQQRINLFLSGGLGFRNSKFPPILCTATDPDTIFYSLVFIIDIILAFGCTLLIIIIGFIHRQSVNFKNNESKNSFQFGTAEKKLLILFCYYVVLAAVALTSFTLGTRNAPIVVDGIQKYFFCEQGGHNPSNPCSLSVIDKYRFPFLSTMSQVLLSLFPVVNLVFAVNIQELKELWRKRVTKNIFTDSPHTGSTVPMTHME